MSRMHVSLSRIVAVASLALTLMVALFALAACGGSEEPAADANAPQISVTLKIDGTEGERGVIFDDDVKVAEGASVYDALLASQVDLSVKESISMGTYVAGIDGLMERAFGSESGWLYSVNGEQAGVSCGDYTVADGDKIEWTYKINALSAS